MDDDLKIQIRKFALLNAFEHNGKTNEKVDTMRKRRDALIVAMVFPKPPKLPHNQIVRPFKFSKLQTNFPSQNIYNSC